MDWVPWAIIGALGWGLMALGTSYLKRIKDALVLAKEIADTRAMWSYATQLAMRPYHHTPDAMAKWTGQILETPPGVIAQYLATPPVLRLTGVGFEAHAMAASLGTLMAALPTYPHPVSLEEALETWADLIDQAMADPLPGQAPPTPRHANAIRALLRLEDGPAMGEPDPTPDPATDTGVYRGTRSRRRRMQ